MWTLILAAPPFSNSTWMLNVSTVTEPEQMKPLELSNTAPFSHPPSPQWNEHERQGHVASKSSLSMFLWFWKPGRVPLNSVGAFAEIHFKEFIFRRDFWKPKSREMLCSHVMPHAPLKSDTWVWESLLWGKLKVNVESVISKKKKCETTYTRLFLLVSSWQRCSIVESLWIKLKKVSWSSEEIFKNIRNFIKNSETTYCPISCWHHEKFFSKFNWKFESLP